MKSDMELIKIWDNQRDNYYSAFKVERLTSNERKRLFFLIANGTLRNILKEERKV